MMLNIQGYKKFAVDKKHIVIIYRFYCKVDGTILYEVAFNELIENLKERNTHLLDCERSVNRTLFMDENSDRSHTKI